MGILIIDDERDTCQFLKSLLEESGYSADMAYSAPEALTKINGCRPDLILLDIHMPIMDGLELGHLLTSDPATFDIPIIILTAFADHENVAWAHLYGIYRVIEKPFSCAEILDAVQDVLVHKEG